MSVTLPVTGPYTAKDQRKANVANKFIGRGSPRSSTNAYAAAYGDNANCGVYTSTDVVFISAEGNRSGRLDPDYDEIKRACDAGVQFITDDAANRARPYNIGERQVCAFLVRQGYREQRPGVWSRPAITTTGVLSHPVTTTTGAVVQLPTILGYQYISINGLPIGGVQPTLEDAEEVAQFDEVGRFYSIERTDYGRLVLRYHYSKGMA